MSGGDLWVSPVIVRCSVVGCREQMPGSSLVAVSDGAIIVSHDVASGWTVGTAYTGSGGAHTVVLCPAHSSVAHELGNENDRRVH